MNSIPVNQQICHVHRTHDTHRSQREIETAHATLSNTLSPVLTCMCAASIHRTTQRHTPTSATFTGQKRTLNNINQVQRSQSNLLINNKDDEHQQVRTRLNTRTSSLPAVRCVPYNYNYHHHHHHRQAPSNTRSTGLSADTQHTLNSRINSMSHERSRSQSYSSSQIISPCSVAVVSPTGDLSEHSSSFDNTHDNLYCRVKRRTPTASLLSTSYNSTHCSQRAVTQFMHERNKARLRRNQKASRMLGRINNRYIRMYSS
jgi:hypothetical protein